MQTELQLLSSVKAGKRAGKCRGCVLKEGGAGGQPSLKAYTGWITAQAPLEAGPDTPVPYGP